MLSRLREGLRRTREALASQLHGLLDRPSPASAQDLEILEEALLTADVGVGTVQRLLADLPRESRERGGDLRAALTVRMMSLWPAAPAPVGRPPSPWVALFIGVNGVGKTTTVGKLAAKRAAEGQRGVLAAGDTFRAAAVEQLAIWAERSGVELVRQQEGADPAAVAYDAVQTAVARGLDFVLVDTAGRLHVKHNLMEELAKIHRVCGKALPGAPHQVTLVLDATTGQNGLAQAKSFLATIPVTDLLLTKLDGTAKGGIALSVAAELGLPIRWAGVGERIEDLIPFDPAEYVEGLLSGDGIH